MSWLGNQGAPSYAEDEEMQDAEEDVGMSESMPVDVAEAGEPVTKWRAFDDEPRNVSPFMPPPLPPFLSAFSNSDCSVLATGDGLRRYRCCAYLYLLSRDESKKHCCAYLNLQSRDEPKKHCCACLYLQSRDELKKHCCAYLYLQSRNERKKCCCAYL